MSNRDDIPYWTNELLYSCEHGITHDMLADAGLPVILAAAVKIGHGLTVALTQTSHDDGLRSLVWVSELTCHPFCAFLGRCCQGENLKGSAWLEIIEKKHAEILDLLAST